MALSRGHNPSDLRLCESETFTEALVTDDLLARLTTAAKRTAELDLAAETERGRRNALIVQARDTGHSWRTIADAASLAVSTCETVVARALGGDLRRGALFPPGGRGPGPAPPAR